MNFAKNVIAITVFFLVLAGLVWKGLGKEVDDVSQAVGITSTQNNGVHSQSQAPSTPKIAPAPGEAPLRPDASIYWNVHSFFQTASLILFFIGVVLGIGVSHRFFYLFAAFAPLPMVVQMCWRFSLPFDSSGFAVVTVLLIIVNTAFSGMSLRLFRSASAEAASGPQDVAQR